MMAIITGETQDEIHIYIYIVNIISDHAVTVLDESTLTSEIPMIIKFK